MKIVENMMGNLDFTAAIGMAELTERLHQLVEHGTDTEISTPEMSTAELQTRYNALFRADGWRCVHAIHAVSAKTWALILQQQDSAQFAVVCSHELTDGKLAAEPAKAEPAQTRSTEMEIPVFNERPQTQNIPSLLDPLGTMERLGLDKLGIDKVWERIQAHVANQAMAYHSLSNEVVPPPENAKVYGPWLTVCQTVQTEVDLFFRALSGLKFVQPALEQQPRPMLQQQMAYRRAIGAALQLRFGPEVGQKMVQSMDSSATSESIEPFTVPSTVFTTEQDSLAIWQIPEAGFELDFTGHGTAGAVAVLCGLYMKRTWETHLDFPLFQLRTYTFGSPKVGNRAFADYYNQQMAGRSYRVQNMLDNLTYGPLDELPFSSSRSLPNSLTWRLPTLNSLQAQLGSDAGMRATLGQLRDGWFTYEHVGEAFRHPGVGDAPAPFNFGAGMKPMALPFAHDPAGYKAMLVDAQKQTEMVAKPMRAVTAQLEAGREQLSSVFESGATQAQEMFSRFQNRMTNG